MMAIKPAPTFLSRQYTQPNELYYGSELMLTKPTIVRMLELGGIRRTKSKKNKAVGMTNKRENKVINKYRNEPIHATSRAIRFAEKYISTGSLQIQDGTIKDKRLEVAKDFDMNNEHFKKGWARRLKVHGGLYGRTYIDEYKSDIQEFFTRGQINSSEKMNAAQIREALLCRYPNRFSLPSETEIKQEISALFAKSKVQKRNTARPQENSQIFIKETNESIDWLSLLDEIVSKNISGKPEEIYTNFTHLMTTGYPISLEDLPLKSIVKKKINYLKQKYKKEAMNVIV